ncbi:hypothetical protein P3T39_003007 [Kitasatospora sp. GP82]|nr:hypothetical protein [Kitasatospora sp. GP82]
MAGSQGLGRAAEIIGILAGLVALVTFFGVKGCGSSSNPGGKHAQVSAQPSPSPSPTGASISATPQPPKPSPAEPASTIPGSQFLVDLNVLDSNFGVNNGSIDLHGKTFGQSVALRVDKQSLPDNYAEYNLSGRWKFFDATVGVTDDSPTGGKLRLQVFIDGRSAYSRQLSIGQSETIHLNVANAMRLKLQVDFAAGEYYDRYSYKAWGDARLSAYVADRRPSWSGTGFHRRTVRTRVRSRLP